MKHSLARPTRRAFVGLFTLGLTLVTPFISAHDNALVAAESDVKSRTSQKEAPGNSPDSVCSMNLPAKILELQSDTHGISSELCVGDSSSKTRSTKLGSKSVQLVVDGPHGSGHFWNLHLSLQKNDGVFGLCFSPNPISGAFPPQTVGWHQVVNTDMAAPLPWVDDIDGDGKAELIIWRSFAPFPNAGNLQMGLIGWVYKLKGTQLVLDLSKSRILARRIQPWFKGNSPTTVTNTKIIEDLQQFANGHCIEE